MQVAIIKASIAAFIQSRTNNNGPRPTTPTRRVSL